MTLESGSVLVTGGAGFIGCALSQLRASQHRAWIAFDNLHPQVHPRSIRPVDLHPSAELVVGDVTNPDDWTALLDRFVPDVVVHLAAETGTAQSLHEATRHASVNVVGTTAMLDAFGRAGVRPSRVVLSSSRAVYGEGEWLASDGGVVRPGQRTHAQLEKGRWDFVDAAPMASEAMRTWPAPTSVYGATKLAQEHTLAAWCGAQDVALSILRFQNVYGPGQSLTNSYTGIVSLFSQWAMDGREIPVYEDGHITRDFVYIDDVARAIDAILRSPAEPGAVTRHDVGMGRGTTVLELAQMIAEFHGGPAPIVTGQYRDGDIRHATCDISRTLTDLPWAPQVEVAEGIERLQGWIAANRLP